MSDTNSKFDIAFAGPLLLAVIMLVILITQTILYKGVLANHVDPVELGCDEKGVIAYQTVEGKGESSSSAPSCSPFFFEPVPINAASKELLMTIPGVGAKTAEKIQQEIIANGSIAGPAGLMKIKGIGTTKMDKMLPYVSFK